MQARARCQCLALATCPLWRKDCWLAATWRAAALAERIKPWSDRQYYGVSASLPLLEFCRRAERIDTAANEKCCAWSPMAKTDKESAEELVISPRTANQHIAYIFLKIDVTSRAAAAYAIRNRLV
jgi:DNA-binding CsgD family transcriptional regulator